MQFRNYSLMLLAVLLMACGGNQDPKEAPVEYPVISVTSIPQTAKSFCVKV